MKCLYFIALAAASVAFAGSDVPLNGDFRGSTVGAATVPGWNKTAGDGAISVLATNDRDEYALQATAEKEAVVLASTPHPVTGRFLEWNFDYKGTGQGKARVEFLNAEGGVIPPVAEYALSKPWYCLGGCEFKREHIAVPANAKSVRFVWEISPGSRLVFSDVEAEFDQD